MGPFALPWVLEHPSDITGAQWFIVRTAGFVLLALIVMRFIVPVIRGMLENRRQAIVETVEQVRTTLAEAERLRDDYRDRLDHIAEETARRLDAAVADAQQLTEHIETQGREQADAIVAQTRAELRRDHEKAMARLRIEFAEEVIEAARHAAARTLTQERQSDLVRAFASEVAVPTSPTSGGSTRGAQ